MNRLNSPLVAPRPEPLMKATAVVSVPAIGSSRPGAAVITSSSTLLKPLTWQGDLALGSGREGEATFVRLDLDELHRRFGRH